MIYLQSDLRHTHHTTGHPIYLQAGGSLGALGVKDGDSSYFVPSGNLT